MSSAVGVCITGVGAVCGAGRTVESIWDAILGGRSAIAPISRWDTSNWPARCAAEVTNVDNRTLVDDRKLHKLISRTDLFGLYAADVAIKQSGLPAYRDTLSAEAVAPFNDRCGVFAGSGGGNYQSNYDFFPLLTAAGGSMETFGRELDGSVNPMWLLRILPNNVLCQIGIRHNFKGTNACITHQCVGGALAIAEAAAALRAGEADRAVAVGHDTPIEPETVLHYHRLGLMSEETLRPFDAERTGTIFGEGAAAVVLETAAEAQGRQATILGEFLGSGCVTEAAGVLEVQPDGDGLARAIQLALDDASLSADAVGFIVAHGNGTRASDASEAAAIRRVFASNPPPVTAFKWAFGHLIAASGTLDLVLALRALQSAIVPGVATFRTADPNLPQLPLSTAPQKPRSNIALVLGRGFAAMNLALLVRADGSTRRTDEG
jgi:3-oxoacyl-[acyl-carrier-protein] synthase-1